MKRAILSYIFLFVAIAGFSQIYLPVTPTTYGRKEQRILPTLVQHLPSSADFSLNTSDVSPQIRVIGGSLYWYYSGSWRLVSGGIIVIDANEFYFVQDSTNTPPVSPVEGQAWLLGGAPTGVWAGANAHKIARYIGGTFTGNYVTGTANDYAQTLDDYVVHQFNGTTWPVQSAPPLLVGGNKGSVRAGTTTASDFSLITNGTVRMLFKGGSNLMYFKNLTGTGKQVMSLANDGLAARIAWAEVADSVDNYLGGTQSLQEVIDVSNVLTRDDTIRIAGNYFKIHSDSTTDLSSRYEQRYDGFLIESRDIVNNYSYQNNIYAGSKLETSLSPTGNSSEIFYGNTINFITQADDGIAHFEASNGLDHYAFLDLDAATGYYEMHSFDSLYKFGVAPKVYQSGGYKSLVINEGTGNIEQTDVSGGGGGVTSVSGTANRITSTGGATPVIDISAIFEALLLKAANNLSDLANAGTARTNLGATTIGSNLFTITNPGAIRFFRANADNTVSMRTAAEMLSDIGGQASGSYQPLDADLTAIAGLTATTNNFIVSVGSAWASRTPTQVKTTLGLTVGSDILAFNISLSTIAGLSPSNNDVLQYKSGLWTNRTLPQYKTDLALDLVDNTSDATKNSATVTLTNKRISARVTTITSSSTPTPDGDASDMFTVTALAAGATFAAPTGTPVVGQKLLIRIKDDGTARTLAWNAIYRAGTDVVLPSTTTISKTMYILFIYNAIDSKWDLLSTTGGY